MEWIKNFGIWKIIIILIVIIIGFLFVNRFLVYNRSYAGNIEELIRSLTSKGYKVNEIREISRPKDITIMRIPDVKKEVFIDNLSINVIIFENDKKAKDTLDLISEDGNRIGYCYISWTHRPHIYQCGNIIVIYVGKSVKMQWDLRHILGHQVKGEKWWEEPLAPVLAPILK